MIIPLQWLKYLVVPTAQTTNGMVVKFFSENTLLLKVDCLEVFYF